MNPQIKVVSESKELGTVPTFNTIATIPGKELPNEYVILSAHFDSWDGATGATDNGTGTITMMEAARILKKNISKSETNHSYRTLGKRRTRIKWLKGLCRRQPRNCG